MEGVKLSIYAAFARTTDYILSDGTFGGFGFFDNANNVTGTNVCQSSIAALGASGFVYPAPQSAGFLGPYTATTCDGYQFLQSAESDYSAEIRLTSDASRRLRWGGGLYFLHSVRQDGISVGDDLGLGIIKNLDNPINSISPTAQLYNDRFTNYALGVFGSADYDIAPQLTLSTGLRYDVEWRKDTSLVLTGNVQDFINVKAGGPANGTFYPLNPGLLADPNGPPAKSATFSQPQPKISLRYTPIAALTLYSSFGIGFKSGGFNRAGTQATIENIAAATGSDLTIGDSYNKEVSYAFEIGAKGQLFDRRVSYQLAAYHTIVNNMQYAEFFTNNQGQIRVVSNIDLVSLSGVEIGLQVKVADWLSLTGGGNITGSRIDKNFVRPETVGNKSPYTPDYTAEIGARLTKSVGSGLNLIGNVTTNFTGPTWFSTVQNNFVPTIFGADGYYGKSQRAAFTTTDLRIGVSSARFELIAFARNLFKEKYLTEVSPAPEFGGSFVSQGPGRLFGGELTVRF
jgi:iron complex outermembrane receptor protein